MSYADHRCGNGFLIDNASGSELHREAEPLLDHGLQDFQLNLAHELQMDLSQALIPEQMELRIFLLQLPEFPQRRMGIGPLGQSHPVGQHRFQCRLFRFRFDAQSLSRICLLYTSSRLAKPATPIMMLFRLSLKST